MSRVGKMPIEVPGGTKVEIQGDLVRAEGPKGRLEQRIPEGIRVELENGSLAVSRQDDSGPQRSLHGLTRALLANAVHGVSVGFTKQLEIIGVGYRAEVQGREAHLALGYSHPIVYPIPEGIDIEIDRQNRITVTGVDRQQVGQVAAELRNLRRPDAYKGKGIRYAGERMRLKVGKAGASSS